MKNKIALATLLLWPLACVAADGFKPPEVKAASFTPLDVKPGLWETSITTEVSGMPPISQAAMAKLTPEQRARMEASVKSRQAKGPQTRVTKSCLTAEDLKKPFALNDDAHAMCKRTVISSSGRKEEVHFECAKGPVKSTGDIRVEAVTPESVQGTSHASSSDGTRSMTFAFTFAGKWLGAECGPFAKKE
jgi:hypothetical protein